MLDNTLTNSIKHQNFSNSLSNWHSERILSNYLPVSHPFESGKPISFCSISDQEQNQSNIDTDLYLAAKESQRDIYDASNQKLQTLILSASIMFAALSTVIIQGQLPDDAPNVLVDAIAYAGTLSFSFLFVAIVICIELLHKTSKFMMDFNARIERKMKEIQESRKKSNSSKDILKKIIRLEDVTTYWETQADVYLERLSSTANEIETIYDCEIESFSKFWEATCRLQADAADIVFYLGTWLFILTTAAFLYSYFLDDYECRDGAFFSMIWFAMTMVLMFAYVLYQRFWSGPSAQPSLARVSSRSLLQKDVMLNMGPARAFGYRQQGLEEKLWGDESSL